MKCFALLSFVALFMSISSAHGQKSNSNKVFRAVLFYTYDDGSYAEGIDKYELSSDVFNKLVSSKEYVGNKPQHSGSLVSFFDGKCDVSIDCKRRVQECTTTPRTCECKTTTPVIIRTSTTPKLTTTTTRTTTTRNTLTTTTVPTTTRNKLTTTTIPTTTKNKLTTTTTRTTTASKPTTTTTRTTTTSKPTTTTTRTTTTTPKPTTTTKTTTTTTSAPHTGRTYIPVSKIITERITTTTKPPPITPSRSFPKFSPRHSFSTTSRPYVPPTGTPESTTRGTTLSYRTVTPNTRTTTKKPLYSEDDSLQHKFEYSK